MSDVGISPALTISSRLRGILVGGAVRNRVDILQPGKPCLQSLTQGFEPGIDPLAVHAEVTLPVNGATVNGEHGL